MFDSVAKLRLLKITENVNTQAHTWKKKKLCYSLTLHVIYDTFRSRNLFVNHSQELLHRICGVTGNPAGCKKKHFPHYISVLIRRLTNVNLNWSTSNSVISSLSSLYHLFISVTHQFNEHFVKLSCFVLMAWTKAIPK